MNILDTRENLNAMVLRHEKEILELKRLVTPMMEFKTPTKVFGPNLEQVLNAAGFYRNKEWVGLTDDEIEHLRNDQPWWMVRDIEAKLKEKNT